MIEAPIGLRLVRGKTRSHAYIADIATFYAITLDGVAPRMGFTGSADSQMILACRAANADIGIPLDAFGKGAVTGKAPDEIIVRVDEKQAEPEGINAAGMESLSERIVAAIFSLFVERGTDWLKRSGSTNFANWPQATNFCRVVRNAIVHGGTINITSPAAVGAQWRSLKYDHTSLGRKVLNSGDLSIGDLVLLMMEMELELNALGAPFDLG